MLRRPIIGNCGRGRLLVVGGDGDLLDHDGGNPGGLWHGEGRVLHHEGGRLLLLLLDTVVWLLLLPLHLHLYAGGGGQGLGGERDCGGVDGGGDGDGDDGARDEDAVLADGRDEGGNAHLRRGRFGRQVERNCFHLGYTSNKTAAKLLLTILSHFEIFCPRSTRLMSAAASNVIRLEEPVERRGADVRDGAVLDDDLLRHLLRHARVLDDRLLDDRSGAEVLLDGLLDHGLREPVVLVALGDLGTLGNLGLLVDNLGLLVDDLGLLVDDLRLHLLLLLLVTLERGENDFN